MQKNVPLTVITYGNVSKYHVYINILTFFTIFCILVTLMISLYILQREHRNVEKRLKLLVNTFQEIDMVPIEHESSILTDYDLQVINAWNRSIEEITKHKALRDKHFNYIVHDLKTPIQILKANIQMYELEYEKCEYIDSIKEELTKLEHSILNYLVVEKISYFEKVQNDNVNLHNFFKIIAKRYQKLGFEVFLDFKSTDNNFYLDRSMFSKVVGNLIDNAMKHGKERKMVITIYKDKIEFRNKLKCQLANDNLFCENMRYHSESGNGLGTQIVKTYVELMKFRISSKCEEDILVVTLDMENNI
ncbi:HAMP domain-containing sensor histidine kinase [Mollicutes bacterium LVI A0039]|nr:HAMP domain-containing sensor histidine kinase [Mollicutes bacterium LVI A0039]